MTRSTNLHRLCRHNIILDKFVYEICVFFFDTFCPVVIIFPVVFFLCVVSVNGSSAGRGRRRFITIYLYIYTYSYAASRNHVSYLCTHVPNAAIASSTAAPHCCVVITVYIFYIHSMVVVVVASMEHSSYNISSRP